MYRMDLNNWHTKPKNSTIYTPKEVSQFLFELLKDKFLVKTGYPILDPGCGQGSLLEPWYNAGYPTYGIDIASASSADLIQDFLIWDGWDIFGYQVKPQLVLCNPPFNGNKKKLLPEIWFDKIIELFGKNIPVVFFAPIGFRLNNTLTSKRHVKFIDGTYPPITSQIALTRDVYNLEPNNRRTEFHSEILIFNIPNLQPHYFFNPTSKIEQRTPI